MNEVILIVTSSGILSAILLVWSQLWITTAQEYKENCNSKNPTVTAGIGLTYTYMAILAAITTFGITIVAGTVNNIALMFLMWSGILTFWLVIGSVVPAFLKTLFNKDILMPMTKSISVFSNLWARIIMIIVLPGIFLVLSCLYADAMFSSLISS